MLRDSQMSKSESDFDKILKNKIEHCGDEAFYLYVFEDFLYDQTSRIGKLTPIFLTIKR